MDMRKGIGQNSTAQTGIVTSVNAQSYRVKVHLSLLDIETDWIRVCSFYVGNGWGLVSLPHVGNEVVVTFLNGDLNDGVVTGILYSEGADVPPDGAEHPALFHESGSKIVLGHNGDIVIEASGNLYLRGANVHINDDR
ncbi:phage baseplate assembly protein V [Sporomusa carbonis]|uniref:phage baseplate assembly protein V n=1 Tax=Sporomusa carbonis TaxID=3076075 RepID=UPI003C7E931C